MNRGLAISVAVASMLAVTANSATPAVAGSRLARGPDGVTAGIVTVADDECPEGTGGVKVLINGSRLVLEYERYQAQSGGSSLPSDRRKSCTVYVKMDAPKGFTYGISSSFNSGHAQLGLGAKATVSFSHSFAGNQENWFTHPMNGAFTGDWHFTDQVSPNSIIWKPCSGGGLLVLHSELVVDQGTSDPAELNFISMEPKADGDHHVYNLAWRTCS